MIWLLYYMLMYLMVAGIRFSSLWSSKSGNWIAGRKKWKALLQQLPVKKGPRIWFHVSSLGEFEQARPVIEKLKEADENLEIILTFFSPSGFMVRSGYPLAMVLYLPADLPGNAKYWLSAICPDIAVFVKYDLWPGYLKELQVREIPTLLISAHWTPGGWLNSRSLPPANTLLRNLKQIFLQHGDYLDYFRRKGFSNIRVAGDTRIDRCLELPAETSGRLPSILKEAGPFDVVAGSTWPADEKLIIEAILDMKLRVLIAPHDVSEENINRLLKSFPFQATRLSEGWSENVDPDVVIIDSIGLLSALYPLGKIAYVGGGFGAGIHNTLEPMAHERPLIFGPGYRKFPEAIEMVKHKAALPVSNLKEFILAIRHFREPGTAEAAGKTEMDYLMKNAGASASVAKYVMESIPYIPKA